MKLQADQKPSFIEQTRERLRQAWQDIAPGRRAWRGAAGGAAVAVAFIILVIAYDMFSSAGLVWSMVGVVFLFSLFALTGGLLALVWHILKAIPTLYTWVLLSGMLVFINMALTALSVSIGIVTMGLGTLAVASLIGAGIAALAQGGWSQLSPLKRTIAVGGLGLGVMGLIAGGIWLLDAGTPSDYPLTAAALTSAQTDTLNIPDPSQPGSYAVHTLFYGSGTYRQREEYGASVDFVTAPVDGSALVERWSSLRTAYWGFGPDALPINGRVWVPAPVMNSEAGDVEPCPLVIIVHGQHPMEEVSDPGYAYLGELLASRGFIVVSVDENFLNLSLLADVVMFQSLVGVDDLRGWLLLEHLQVWREWNETPDSPFYQKVDVDHIALIGHSRGGQAVAAAAAFNPLPYYPDDASVRFDYGFGIRSVVAIAPVDGGYLPAEQEIVLENINYLVLQGAHDMDVFMFQGDRQYSRVHFNDGTEAFKAAVYIYGANHGQFNTSWGRKDLFEPVMRVFNLEQLMPGEQQRQVAKVTIGAFLEATLQGKHEYRALFQNLRRGQTWLPETLYLHQYRDSATQMLCTYEEDIDLTSTTLPGGQLVGENLTVWREQPITSKWKTLGDQTVYLGWALAATGGTASYTIHIPEQARPLREESALVFSLADANEDPNPDTQDKEKENNQQPIDLTVEVVDSAGNIARLPLSHVSRLQLQLKGHLGKAEFMSPFPTSEAVLQYFEFPLDDFAATNPALDTTHIAQVRLVFDRTESGVIVLDNVGLR